MNYNRKHWGFGLAIVVVSFLTTYLALQSSVPEPDVFTTEALQLAADKWYSHNSVTTIPEANWPYELKHFNPKTVRITSEGVFISFYSLFTEERGLFILPSSSEYQPQKGTDPSFEHVRGRIYKYRIKG